MNIIGRVGGYLIFTIPDEEIHPGRQLIGVNSTDLEAAYILQVLTGAALHKGQEIALVDKTVCRIAAHDGKADQQLRDLVDLATDLRATSPELMQLEIQLQGLNDNE